VTPLEFVAVRDAAHELDGHHSKLLANALAQAQALLVGRGEQALRPELEARGYAGTELDAAIAARRCPGNRASTTLLLPTLDARTLGALLALYEHRTFVEGVLYGINSFDQWGVELGKSLAKPLVAAIAGDTPLTGDVDASTRSLVAHVRALQSAQR
jgi:glucose-6-phosphate isomerase